jgi:hypothetical protein
LLLTLRFITHRGTLRLFLFDYHTIPDLTLHYLTLSLYKKDRVIFVYLKKDRVIFVYLKKDRVIFVCLIRRNHYYYNNTTIKKKKKYNSHKIHYTQKLCFLKIQVECPINRVVLSSFIFTCCVYYYYY